MKYFTLLVFFFSAQAFAYVDCQITVHKTDSTGKTCSWNSPYAVFVDGILDANSCYPTLEGVNDHLVWLEKQALCYPTEIYYHQDVVTCHLSMGETDVDGRACDSSVPFGIEINGDITECYPSFARAQWRMDRIAEEGICLDAE